MDEVTGRERPKKERAKAAVIRGIWSALLPGVGFAVTYLADIDRLREFGIAIPIAIGIGAVLYSAKKYWFPDTEW